MAKINKVELNLGHKIANPFRTTRKSDTNPFKYQDFEGNTIDPLICADVLVSFKGKENKLKMIASSVMGSLTRLRTGITEPIANFVRRVKDGISNAWSYAKNTEIKIAGLDGISTKIHDVMSYDVGKGISDSISGIGKNITDRMAILNRDMTDFSHGISDKWNSLIEKVNLKNIGHDKISSNLSVAELKDLWIKENELIANQNKAKEITLNSVTNKEVKVA